MAVGDPVFDSKARKHYVNLALEQLYEGTPGLAPRLLKEGLFTAGVLEVPMNMGLSSLPPTSLAPLAEHFNIEEPEKRFAKELFSNTSKQEYISTYHPAWLEGRSTICRHFKLNEKEVEGLVKMGQQIEHDMDLKPVLAA